MVRVMDAQHAPITVRSASEVDPVTSDDIKALAGDGPADALRLSILMPTHRMGAEVRQDPVQFRKLVDRAADRLMHDGHADKIETLLGPARALLADADYWQHQSEGLAIYSSAGVHREIRVPLPLQPMSLVGDTFHIAPLAPLLAGENFLVLAVSKNDVRLFAGDRWSITQLETGPMPTSMAEALAHEDPERQLQSRSSGTGDAMFHGHGSGSEDDKAEVERFLRAVDHGMHDLLGADRRPLVLACVGYYAPIFRSVSKHADIVESAIEGSPERHKPAELHQAAWERLQPRFVAALDAEWARYNAAISTDHATTKLSETGIRAAEGRVETLFVSDHVDLNDDRYDAGEVDRAMLATINASGRIVTVPADRLPEGNPAVALLRY